jgi:hypothetical protein
VDISIDYAQVIVGDPEAISRGYLSSKTIEDAQKLAAEAMARAEFGMIGHLSPIGSPHQYWIQASPIYKELAESSAYKKDRIFSNLLKLANYIALDPLIEKVEASIKHGDPNDCQLLKKWLKENISTL